LVKTDCSHGYKVYNSRWNLCSSLTFFALPRLQLQSVRIPGIRINPERQYIKLFGSQSRRSSPAGAGLPFRLGRPSNRLEHAFAACFVPRKLQLSFVNFNEATRRICWARLKGDFCTDSSKSKAMLQGAGAAAPRLVRGCSFGPGHAICQSSVRFFPPF